MVVFADHVVVGLVLRALNKVQVVQILLTLVYVSDWSEVLLILLTLTIVNTTCQKLFGQWFTFTLLPCLFVIFRNALELQPGHLGFQNRKSIRSRFQHTLLPIQFRQFLLHSLRRFVFKLDKVLIVLEYLLWLLAVYVFFVATDLRIAHYSHQWRVKLLSQTESAINVINYYEEFRIELQT